MSRTALAFVVAALLAVLAGLLGSALGLGSWGFTALAIAVGLLATLVDREGFYGPRERHARRS
ncbi:MAG: hypothetical protein ACRDN8_04945 [Thermoleophilaceae bacterium]